MSYDVIPAGDYIAVAVVSEGDDGNGILHHSITKNGYDQLVVRFSITEGEYKGRGLIWYASLATEISAGSQATEPPCVATLKGLRAMGFEGDRFADAYTQALDQPVRISVEIAEWQGKTFNRVRWVNDLRGVAAVKINAPDEKRKRLVAAAMDRFLKPATATAPPRQAARAEHQDDIPF